MGGENLKPHTLLALGSESGIHLPPRPCPGDILALRPRPQLTRAVPIPKTPRAPAPCPAWYQVGWPHASKPILSPVPLPLARARLPWRNPPRPSALTCSPMGQVPWPPPSAPPSPLLFRWSLSKAPGTLPSGPSSIACSVTSAWASLRSSSPLRRGESHPHPTTPLPGLGDPPAACSHAKAP